jgi:arylsulfatase A-like enzyme
MSYKFITAYKRLGIFIFFAAVYISLLPLVDISFADNDLFHDAVAIWHMDEINNGIIKDEKGKYSSKVLSNLKIVKGRLNSGIYFDGMNSYLQTPVVLKNWTGFTLSLWIKPEKIGFKKGLSAIFDTGHSEKEKCVIQLENETGNTAWICSGRAIGFKLQPDVWSHVVFVADGYTKKIMVYINGILIGEADIPKLVFDKTYLTFGSLASMHDRYFQGAVDEVAIWDRPLNDKEIRGIYNYYIKGLSNEILEYKVDVLEQKIDGITGRIDYLVGQTEELRKLADFSTIGKPIANNSRKPNVIMIVSDALRADHISAINSKAKYKTPNIDKLAKMGMLFTNAISQGPFTRSGMGSIFTGLYPSEHKAYEGLLPINQYQFLKQRHQISGGVRSFLSILAANGYGRFMISQNYKPQDYGMPYITNLGDIDDDPKTAIDIAINFVRSAAAPYFLYIHIFDPHHPYDRALNFDPTLPRRVSPPMLNDLKVEHKKYSLVVQNMDMEVGRLIDYLIGQDYFKNNVLIFLSDHGEYFNERPEFHSDEKPINKLFPHPHGFDLHQEQIHVPLIMVTPATLGKKIVIKRCVESRALFSTIVELTGSCCVNTKKHPKSLMPSAVNDNKNEYCMSEGVADYNYTPHYGADSIFNEYPFNIELKSIIAQNGLKLIHNTLHKTDLLYDLNKDPDELHPLDTDSNRQKILELKQILMKRIDVDENFKKPEPYERILSMPQNNLISGINASHNSNDHHMTNIIDYDDTTFWQRTIEKYKNSNVTIILKNSEKVKQKIQTSRQDQSQWFKNARLIGSNDGYTWTKIADVSVANNSIGKMSWELVVDKAYKYYKLNILEPFDSQQKEVSIAEIRLVLKEDK